MHDPAAAPRAPALWLTTILPFGLGYVITMVFRSVNAVLEVELAQDLGLSAARIGLVTAIYALTFALTQIPLGLLLDTWGERRTQATFFVIGAAGAVLFGLAPSFGVLLAGRALLGVGMAGGLMAAFKAVAERVPHERIPFYNGVILGAGGLGSLLAASPAKHFVDAFGWRTLCVALGAAAIAVALIILTVNRDVSRPHDRQPGLRRRLRGVLDICRDRAFWRVTPMLTVTLGGFIAVQGLWLGPWLQRVEGLTPERAATMLSVVALAMTMGFLSGGAFARLADMLGVKLVHVVVAGVMLHMLTQSLIAVGVGGGHMVTWAAYGYLAQVTLVVYALLSQRFGPALSGRALTAANILVFLFAFAYQYAFGVIVQLWPAAGAEPESVRGFRAALWLLIGFESAALLWFAAQRDRDRPGEPYPGRPEAPIHGG